MNLPDTINRPLLITSALLAGLGPLVGNGIYAGPTGDGEALQRSLADPPASAYVGHLLELVGFAAMATVFAILCVWLARRTPVAAMIVGITAAAGLAVKVGSIAPTLAVAQAPDVVDPHTADVLVATGDMAFIVFGFLFSVAFAALGLGLLRADAPRWLGWWAAVGGGLGVAAAMVGLLEPDLYFFVPFTTLLLWLVVLGLTEAFGKSGVAHSAVGAVPVPE
jgi:Domain of unknown function (DUF4386)